MKKHLFILLTLFFALAGCNNDDDNKPADPVSQLPPATQTGENTFGCLLDGKAFLPGPGANPLDCVYQYVDGGYYFALQGSKNLQNFIAIGINTNNLELIEGNNYNLTDNEVGNAYGLRYFNYIFNYTTTIHSGQLSITKLDYTNHIVSGTFWFDVMDENGVVHQIREGRFDMHFTT
ncbi:hypothetical protein ACLI09_07000 [Flavobacterium sp. RHBU_24]|uniref:hypothetical protein n=1 Tax=Flavobacterium sp. RHBU_24 TaxID=3391185 RepID=UPI0039849097